MNFFKTIFAEKLAAMRAAAPRATLRMLHESNGFSLYLDEAAAARRLSQLGTLTDHAEDILEDSVPVLFIPLEQTIKFVEEVTAHHSVAFVDVCLASRVHNARHTMYAYFPRKNILFSNAPVLEDDLVVLMPRVKAPEGKKSADDFWG